MTTTPRYMYDTKPHSHRLLHGHIDRGTLPTVGIAGSGEQNHSQTGLGWEWEGKDYFASPHNPFRS